MTLLIHRLRRPLAFLVTVAAGAFASSPYASSELTLAGYVIGSGGGSMSGGAFSLTGTIGQSVAGSATGGAVVNDAGFWPSADAGVRPDRVFSDGFE